jgi:hypothetical protein
MIRIHRKASAKFPGYEFSSKKEAPVSGTAGETRYRYTTLISRSPDKGESESCEKGDFDLVFRFTERPNYQSKAFPGPLA